MTTTCSANQGDGWTAAIPGGDYERNRSKSVVLTPGATQGGVAKRRNYLEEMFEDKLKHRIKNKFYCFRNG